MENLQLETLKSSQTHFTFPPHRRRLLKSKTVCTFVQILSRCCNHSPAIEAVPEEPKLDNNGSELGQVSGCDELVGHNHIESENLLVGKDLLVDDTREVPARTKNNSGTELAQVAGHDELVGHNTMELENSLVGKNLLVDENREIMGSGAEGHSNSHMEIDGLDHLNVVEGNEELGHDNNTKFDNPLGDKDPNYSNDVVDLIDNQEDQFNFPEFDMEEFGPLDGDMIAGSSKSNENKVKKTPLVEINEDEMQLKEKELEKLLSSSHRSSAEEEIEEGEIEGDAGVYGDLMDFLLEDDTSLEEQRVDKGQISQGIIIDKEELTDCQLQRGYEKDVESTPLSTNVVDNASYSMEDELRESYINLVGSKSESARNKKQVSLAKESDGPATSLDNLASGFSGRNETENKVASPTQEDAGTKSKKRRRGPQTAEKKEKRKREKKIRRAEKNRRDGVKRWKYQPGSEEKRVNYCNHYLDGRCYKGEMCKFSHDIEPRTKSMPCCHFARGSCMSGNCQFDHQLSNYPCNKYLNGSCHRGADCLFSHEMPAKEGGPTTSNVSKPEMKTVSLPSKSNPKQQMNGHDTSHRNISAKSSSIGISPRKSTEQNVAISISKPATPAPKGISFLSNGYLSRGNQTVDNVAKTGKQTFHSASLDLVPNTTPSVAPRGVNFLSFGKAPLNDSTKKPSILLFNQDQEGIVKSSLSDSVASKTPPEVAPRATKPLSFDKSQLDNSSNKKQANTISKEDNAVSVSSSLGKLGGDGQSTSMSSFSQKVLLSSTPSSVQKALRSTLAFAAKMDRSVGASTQAGSSSQSKSTKASTILDFLYGDRNKSK